LRHIALAEKLARLNLPDNVYNWLTDFLNDHSHCTQYNGVTSAVTMIKANIVPGSALGPASFVVATSDLKADSMNNSLKKYADDAFLIIPADNRENCRT